MKNQSSNRIVLFTQLTLGIALSFFAGYKMISHILFGAELPSTFPGTQIGLSEFSAWLIYFLILVIGNFLFRRSYVKLWPRSNA